MTGPRVGVLALQGDVREHLAMLCRAGAEATVVRRPAELAALDGVVLPGGESTTIAKLARTFDVLAPLRERIRSGLPAFGTCAGMVLLADQVENAAADQETLGGLDVVVRRNAFGRQVDSFESDVELLGPLAAGPADGSDARPAGVRPFPGVFIRAPWVEKTGRDVEVLARVATGPAVGRIVAVRQADILATSFHPEVTGDHRFHAFFVDLVRARGTGAGADGSTDQREEE